MTNCFKPGDIVRRKGRTEDLTVHSVSGRWVRISAIETECSAGTGYTEYERAPIRVGDTVEVVEKPRFGGACSGFKPRAKFVAKYVGPLYKPGTMQSVRYYNTQQYVGYTSDVAEFYIEDFKRVAPDVVVTPQPVRLNTTGPHNYGIGDTVVCVADKLSDRDTYGYFGEIGKEYVIAGYCGASSMSNAEGSSDVKFVGGGSGDRRRFKLVRRKPTPTACPFKVGDVVRRKAGQQLTGYFANRPEEHSGRITSIGHDHYLRFNNNPSGWSYYAYELVEEDNVIRVGDTVECQRTTDNPLPEFAYIKRGERYIVDRVDLPAFYIAGQPTHRWTNTFKKVQPQPAQAASKDTPMAKPTTLRDLKPGDRFEVTFTGKVNQQANDGDTNVTFDGSTNGSHYLSKGSTGAAKAFKQIDVKVKAGDTFQGKGDNYSTKFLILSVFDHNGTTYYTYANTRYPAQNPATAPGKSTFIGYEHVPA